MEAIFRIEWFLGKTRLIDQIPETYSHARRKLAKCSTRLLQTSGRDDVALSGGIRLSAGGERRRDGSRPTSDRRNEFASKW